MSKSQLAFLLIPFVVLAAAAAFFNQQFSRVKQVEVGNTALQLGVVNRIVLTNKASGKAEFLLRCYLNSHEEGMASLVVTIKLAPNESQEVDVYPDLSPGNLPRAIANKTCVAFWKGPLGIQRRAWRANWQYFRATWKSAA
jgi:hypothetical protein